MTRMRKDNHRTVYSAHKTGNYTPTYTLKRKYTCPRKNLHTHLYSSISIISPNFCFENRHSRMHIALILHCLVSGFSSQKNYSTTYFQCLVQISKLCFKWMFLLTLCLIIENKHVQEWASADCLSTYLFLLLVHAGGPQLIEICQRPWWECALHQQECVSPPWEL